jgi:pyridoxal phosphate enzyme (YggS family)
MTISRKSELEENLRMVEHRVAETLVSAGRNRSEVTLIVVTKTFPVEDILLLYELGVRDFGENRDQEGSLKAPLLPSDVRWHFQGQIQSRKIASISLWADVVHSLDSLEHAEKFAKRESENGQYHEYFLQVSLDPEAEHRGGVAISNISDFLIRSPLAITGLMVVPPIEADPGEAFARVASLAKAHGLAKISMGMSGDFEDALKAGATHIRVGSSILGSRPPLA